jgi:RNA polymerase sigma factor (sigma-70 family)
MILKPLSNEEKSRLNVVYQQNYQWLYACLCKHLSVHQHVEDIIQDTFLRVIVSPKRLSQIQSPRAYLLTTAKNIVINQARRKKIEMAYLQMLAEHEQVVQHSPEQMFLLVESINVVAQAMAGLARRQQQVLILHYIEGISQTEIAQRFSLSRKTIQKHLAKAIMHCHLQIQLMDHDA